MKALQNGHLLLPDPQAAVARCGAILGDIPRDLVGVPADQVCRGCRNDRSGWATSHEVLRSVAHPGTWVPFALEDGDRSISLGAGPLRAAKAHVENEAGPGRWYHVRGNRWEYEVKVETEDEVEVW